MSVLEALQKDDYRIGNLQAVVYDRKKTQAFKEGFLSDLYRMFKGNRYGNDPNGLGILEVLFCGMQDVGFDAIVDYWLHHALAVLGIWHGDVFEPAGIAFPTIMIGTGDQEKACYAGYGFKKSVWGTDEQEVLTVLGLSILFQEMNLKAIHGMRLTCNNQTKQFMARFGFVDVATLPSQMVRGGKLVDEVISTCPRHVFEAKVEKMILDAYIAKKNLGE